MTPCNRKGNRCSSFQKWWSDGTKGNDSQRSIPLRLFQPCPSCLQWQEKETTRQKVSCWASLKHVTSTIQTNSCYSVWRRWSSQSPSLHSQIPWPLCRIQQLLLGPGTTGNRSCSTHPCCWVKPRWTQEREGIPSLRLRPGAYIRLSYLVYKLPISTHPRCPHW